jgi:hypothetical protein
MTPWKAALALPLLLCIAASGRATALELVVPAYFYPEESGSPWNELFTAAGSPIVIVNPESGPGDQVDLRFTMMVDHCRMARMRMVGYVDTNYGKVASDKVEKQIDQYRSFYGITDIFIDECSSDKAKLGYYKTLTAYVKSQTPGAITVLNPGTVPDEGYMDAGDIVCIFEDSLAARAKATFPSWMRHYAPSRFLEIVYNVPDSELERTVRRAVKNGVGYFFATDENQTNADPGSPYDKLPSYYPREVKLAASLKTRSD